MLKHSPHHTHARCEETSNFSTSFMWRSLKLLHIWRNFSTWQIFLHISNCEICNKYEVCAAWKVGLPTNEYIVSEPGPPVCKWMIMHILAKAISLIITAMNNYGNIPPNNLWTNENMANTEKYNWLDELKLNERDGKLK